MYTTVIFLYLMKFIRIIQKKFDQRQLLMNGNQADQE